MRKSFAFPFVRYFQFSKWNYSLGSSQIRDAMRFSILFSAIFAVFGNKPMYLFGRLWSCTSNLWMHLRLSLVLWLIFELHTEIIEIAPKIDPLIAEAEINFRKKKYCFTSWNNRGEIKIRLNFSIANKMCTLIKSCIKWCLFICDCIFANLIGVIGSSKACLPRLNGADRKIVCHRKQSKHIPIH